VKARTAGLAEGGAPVLSPERALPLYLQLAAHLQQLIVSGAIAAEDALPPERTLAARFGVSRVTVRKALARLNREGLLRQRQGAGTFVSRPPHVEQPLSALTGFTEDMQSRGLRAGSVWLERAVGPARPEEAMALALSPGQPVARLRRIREADGAPMALEEAVLPARLLPDPEAVEGSLYALLRGRGIKPQRALQRLSAILLSAEQAALLQVPPGSSALYIERRTFLPDGSSLEFVRSHYRGDAYDFVVELTLSAPAAMEASR